MTPPRSLLWLTPVIVVLQSLSNGAHAEVAKSSDAELFEGKVRPLLEKHCVECHGAKKQKGELRLDAKHFAFKGGHEGVAIVPGDALKSPLLKRVLSKNDDERMPPEGERLSGEQIELLKSWIEKGANWPENAADKAAAVDKRLQHWSVLLEKVSGDAPASIDRFVSAKLAEKGLALSPEADRRTLLRRLSFDLLGLPPNPEQVDDFIHSKDPKAYEKAVEQMLTSPHYGERWARHWLDIAHYADSHGFERDQIRPNAWRYRDYVIDSLNADKPYDRFLREQIAGDVFAPNDPTTVLATGFLAAGPWDFAGNVETKSESLRRASRAGDLDDIVTQVMTSTMGITVNCARCHDHKLDPITQKEYFQLCSVFSGVKRGDRDVNAEEAKRLRAQKADLQAQLAEVSKQIARTSGEVLDLADMVGGGDGRGSGTKGAGIVQETGEVTVQKLGWHRNVKANVLRAPVFDATTRGKLAFLKGVFLPNAGEDGQASLKLAEKIVLKDFPGTSGLSWDAVRNGSLNAQVHSRIGDVDYSTEGHSVLGLHGNSGVVFDLGAIRKASGLVSLRLTAAVGFGANPAAANSLADFAVYADGERVLHRAKLRKSDSLSVDLVLPATVQFLTLMATDGGDGIGSDLLFLGDARLRPENAPETLTDADRLQNEKLKIERTRLTEAVAKVAEPAQFFGVLSENQPPVTLVHRRGNPEDPGQEVMPGAFAWANHAPAGFGDNQQPEGQRRVALADWITHPQNTLTRRVLVNRLWHHHFGQGLVLTPSDFGLGGDKPSHPELLDWLSSEFLKGGWSLKHLHKLIVMSAAYRQQSTVLNPKASEIDASNRLLWRQNPRRLDAESVRDAVLKVAGTLNPERGGAGFRDFRYIEAYAPVYQYINPEKPELWKRSIYRFIVRTTPHHFLSTLDCPDPANLTPARINTTTALQALAMSNNEFILQHAKHLAARIENESGAREMRLRRAFELVLQRSPTGSELAAATSLMSEQNLFAICRMLLNTNEFLYID
jgi:mono/diheme cytochrome c family protein